MILTGLLLGLALGFVMQRGRFCVTGMLRDIFTLKSWRGFTALLIVIAVHAVGLAALTSLGIITPEPDKFAPIAVTVGGFIFGLGIVLAGGCASGTWYRSAEGLVGSWFALLFYGLSTAAMKAGPLNWLNKDLRGRTIEATTLQDTLGISVWWLVIPFAIGTAALAAHFLRIEASSPKPATLAPRKSGLAHLLTEKPWHFYFTAVVIGVLGVIAWPLSAAAGRNSGLGITTPTGDIVRFIATGDTSRIGWGPMLVIGLLIGAFIAAKASGEFRVRVPSPKQAQSSIYGGIAMGVGASLAGGCTVGNGMVDTSLFTYQGWVALLFIAFGVGAGAKLWLKPTDAVPGSLINTDGAQPYAQHPQVTVTDDSDFTADDQELLNGAVPAGARTATPVAGAAGVSAFPSAVGILERPHTVTGGQASGLKQVAPGQYVLDTLGAVCPFPLIDAREAISRLDVGEELIIDFDCTQATDSIPRWAADNGHHVTKFEATGDAGWVIHIKKGR